MYEIEIRENGRTIDQASLKYLPNMGDIIGPMSYKGPVYLIKRVQYFPSSEVISLHVKSFANETVASLEIEGFK